MEAIGRYAVYYAPPAGSALARFGAAWLGWDVETGSPAGPLAVEDLPRPVAELTAEPRKYGFHGTLKAPFRLADGATQEALGAAVAALVADHEPFTMPRLELVAIGRFLALVPGEPCPPLDRLAAACVTEIDQFRAPMAPEERERRAAGLDARRRAHLDRWGYPHVLDAFRFHLTLTGPLDEADRAATARALAPVLAPILAEDHPFRDICLFGETASGAFRILERFRLSG